jgi:hypothetical protein
MKLNGTSKEKPAYVDRFEGILDNEHPEVCEAGHYM